MVGSGIHWRSSEVEAAAVALSPSRCTCAAARMWKSQAGWEVCSRASTSMWERVSAAALLCPGKCQISEVNCEMKSKYWACLGECFTRQGERANVRGL